MYYPLRGALSRGAGIDMESLGLLAASVGGEGDEITTASLSAALGALLAGTKGGGAGARGGGSGEIGAAESSMALLHEALSQLQSDTFEEALGGLERRQFARAALAAGGAEGSAIQLHELTLAKDALAALVAGQSTEMSAGELLVTAAGDQHFGGGHRCVFFAPSRVRVRVRVPARSAANGVLSLSLRTSHSTPLLLLLPLAASFISVLSTSWC
jgi:hypothetical protein